MVVRSCARLLCMAALAAVAGWQPRAPAYGQTASVAQANAGTVGVISGGVAREPSDRMIR